MSSKYKFSEFSIKSLAILGVALLFIAYGSCKNGNSAELTSFNTTIDSFKHLNDQTVTMLGALQMKIDEVTTEKNRLDSVVSQKNREIERLRKEVVKLKRANKKAAHNKKTEKSPLIATEQGGYAEMYQAQIKQLQAEKASLIAELNGLRNAFEHIRQLGSIVHVSNIRFEAVKLKKRGKVEKLVTKAKKMNELKIIYDIDENSITEDGNKTLYIVIKGPDGKVLTDQNNHSGFFKSSEGATMDYSVMKDVYIKNGKPVSDLACSWMQNGTREKGEYSVAIYNNGHRVGAGNVLLK